MSKAVSLRLVFLADEVAGWETRGLLAQHGLSVYIEAIDEKGRVHRVLFDTGQYGDAIVHNARLLGIDLGGLEAVALSHHHYDHTGGIREVLQAAGKRVPVVAHPSLFKPSLFISRGGVRLDIGIPYRRQELEELGAHFILVRDSVEVAPGVYWLGEIPRVYPELAPGLPGNYTVDEDGRLVPHKLLDDTGLAIKVEDYGLVVIGGCSHSGIANIAAHAARLLGEAPRLVAGGFHMVSMSEDRVRETIRVLKDELGVEEVHAGHCTGLRAKCMLRDVFGQRFHELHVGHEIRIGRG